MMTAMMIILGVFLMIGGVSCMFTPVATLFSAGYFIGICMLVFGLFGIIRCVKEHGHPLEWILNILALVVGIISFVKPGSTLIFDSMMVFTLAAFFLVNGLVLIVRAIQTKAFNNKWVLELIIGILSLALGIYSFVHPEVAAVTTGVLIGLSFFESGISMIILAIAANKMEQQ